MVVIFGGVSGYGVAVLVEEAVAAAVVVVGAVGVADADLEFEVPVLVENPLVTVGDAGADVPSLEVTALVLPLDVGEWAAEGQGHVEIAEVILAAEEVDTDEVSSELFAEPVAVFGHDVPELEVGFAELPGVKRAGELESTLAADAEFDADVGCGCRPA